MDHFKRNGLKFTGSYSDSQFIDLYMINSFESPNSFGLEIIAIILIWPGLWPQRKNPTNMHYIRSDRYGKFVPNDSLVVAIPRSFAIQSESSKQYLN